ncbi:MAG: GGDEF domain-containing protein [Chloroflexi bacterium]|nr:GGDEF domain-containing protein [Chloroflexota bacterium]
MAAKGGSRAAGSTEVPPRVRRRGRASGRAAGSADVDLLDLHETSPEALWARRLTIGIGVLSGALALLVAAEFVAGEASPADILIVIALAAMAGLTLVTIRLVGVRDRQRAAELEDTARLIRSLSRAVSPDAVVEAIAGEVGFATEADHVVVVRRRPRAWALDATLVSVGGDVAPSTTTLPSTDLVPAGRPEDASLRRLEAHVADAFALRHTIAAPLVVEAGLVGAIVLSRRTGQAWGDTARRRLAVSAAEASAALERAYTLSDAEARAQTDPLTGLPNRRRFDQAARDLAGRRRAGDRVGLLMIDLDHFKRLNDELGHPAGDRVLVAVARAIAGSVRDVDLPARVGGEEFAVILRDPSGAAEVAERLRAAIAAIDLSDHGIPGVTASVGVAVAADPDEQIASLVRRADDALLRAKREGRDRVVAG